MKLVKIFANEGMRVRIPSENYRVLGEEGAVVQWSMHWAKAKERGEIKVEDYAAPEQQPSKGKAKGPEKPKAPEPKTPGIAVS